MRFLQYGTFNVVILHTSRLNSQMGWLEYFYAHLKVKFDHLQAYKSYLLQSVNSKRLTIIRQLLKISRPFLLLKIIG